MSDLTKFLYSQNYYQYWDPGGAGAAHLYSASAQGYSIGAMPSAASPTGPWEVATGKGVGPGNRFRVNDSENFEVVYDNCLWWKNPPEQPGIIRGWGKVSFWTSDDTAWTEAIDDLNLNLMSWSVVAGNHDSWAYGNFNYPSYHYAYGKKYIENVGSVDYWYTPDECPDGVDIGAYAYISGPMSHDFHLNELQCIFTFTPGEYI